MESTQPNGASQQSVSTTTGIPPTTRVNPRYPLMSSIPPSSSLHDAAVQFEGAVPNDVGTGKTGSRRRKAGDQSDFKSLREPQLLPAAPDVPKSPRGPPVSYRDPNTNSDGLPVQNSSSRSFAARAGAIPDKLDPLLANSAMVDRMPVLENKSRSRAGSVNQASKVERAEVRQPNAPSFSTSVIDPASPQESSNAASPRMHNLPKRRPPQPLLDTNMSPTDTNGTLSPLRSGTRRTLAGGAERPTEWAPDRSPLQKLEVKLNDISKEEKRARVQEAEQRLRESKAALAAHGTNTASIATRRAASNPVSSKYGASGRTITQPQTTQDSYGRVVRSSSERNPASWTIAPNSVAKERQRPIESPSSTPGYVALLEDRSLHHSSQAISQSRGEQKRRKSAETAGINRGEERGVRFENDGNPNGIEETKIPPMASSTRKVQIGSPTGGVTKNPPIEKKRADKQSEASYKDNHKNDVSARIVPPQQALLYSERLEVLEDQASAEAYDGSPRPFAGHTTRGKEHALKYVVPPQTVSGINARQSIGFGSRATEATAESDHHKHHVSELLHHHHHHHDEIGKSSIPNAGPPKHLDEWRNGGVARLTLADFTSEEMESKKQSAWWEEQGKSGGRRRSSASRDIERTSAALDGTQEGINGIVQFSSLQPSLSALDRGTFRKSRDAVRARQYIGYDGTLRPKQRNRSWLREQGSIVGSWHAKPSEHVLTSSYSYSCEQLSEHDPSHFYHICKPYMSKLLTRSMRCIRIRIPAAPTSFNPPLLLKCGPLLRYTGVKRDKLDGPIGRSASTEERETWRGSVMIVTVDADSSYDPLPTLRLFHQPMDLLPPPPQQFDGSVGGGLPAEYIDPVAGLPKMSRTGGTVYVKPADDLEEGKDVSCIEDDDGLYEVTRTANVPTAYGKADELLGRSPLPVIYKNRPNQRNGQRSGRFQEVKGIRLHAERGVTFWRFNLEVELGESQARIAYRINKAASIGFWVPARGQTMNVMFHSCNGFSLSVDPAQFSGPDPLWRDVLNAHQTRPFHVMLGGGDQIYNDAVMKQTTLFQEWLAIKNPLRKHEAKFTPEMQEELETFYLERYSMWFSQGLFGMANSQIPMINIWDDHDIIDGFGSYPHHFMKTPVFSGLGNVAFKYYMLFQHQSVPDEQSSDEASWILGASRGPYINEYSRSVFMFLGKKVAFLGLDCRTERMREEILSEASYDLVFDRCRKEIVQGETKHLIVLLGVPIAYPRLVWLENILTSRMMDPIKALGRAGMFTGLLNQFDGGVEILDDLDDHWTAKNHKEERNWFVERLQDLAAEKSVRITILGGDVHLAAVGQFYSNPKLRITKDRDPRYMPNVISSAIVNTPPPEMMGDILNKRNKVHHLDPETDEDMIPMFTHDVDGKGRNNKRLLPRRNYCVIMEYQPGSTPAPTPPLSLSEASEESVPQRPQNRLQRTLSLTRGNSRPAGLFRRLSKRAPPSPDDSHDEEGSPSPQSPPTRSANDGYFPSQPKPTVLGDSSNSTSRNVSAPLPIRPIQSFHRRPTNLSEKAVAKAGGMSSEVNLEHGLDIIINCEVSQGDPAGCTVPYRLLVPALWYEDGVEGLAGRERNQSWLKRLGSQRLADRLAGRQGFGQGGGTQSETESESESEMETARFGTGKLLKRNTSVRQNYSDSQGRSLYKSQNLPQTQSPNYSLGQGEKFGREADSVRQPAGSDHAMGPIQLQTQALTPSQSPSYSLGQGVKLNKGTGSLSQAAGSSQTRSPVQALTQNLDFNPRPGPGPGLGLGVTHGNGSLRQPGASPQTSSPLARTSQSMNMGSPPLSATPRQRSGSKFDANGNSTFFGTSIDSPSGGKGAGGYGGIEAYREEKKGWRRFF